jgi:LysM repeat protein
MRTYRTQRITPRRVVRRNITKPKKQFDFHWEKFSFKIKDLFQLLEEKPFIAQIVGVSFITLAVIVCFETLVKTSSPDVSANLDSTTRDVRVLSNFNLKNTNGSGAQTVIEEVSLPQPKQEINETNEVSNSVQTPPKTHTIKTGDTLLELAKTYNISVEDIATLNGIEDPTKIQVGLVLIVEETKPAQ